MDMRLQALFQSARPEHTHRAPGMKSANRLDANTVRVASFVPAISAEVGIVWQWQASGGAPAARRHSPFGDSAPRIA